MLARLSADSVAAIHLAAIAFLLTGGILSWRWPWLAWVHATLAAAILLLALTHADCPLTTLELRLRERAGQPPYQGGFIAHYLIGPIHAAGITPRVRIAMYLTAIAPNALAYGVLLARQRRSPG